MDSSPERDITDSQATAFFLSPHEPLHRQYEALRAFFIEEIPSAEAAQRFGYSPGSFRVLCHQFRHDPEKRSLFFRPLPRGARPAPARDPVRELVVAMRKRNLSVYDIQRELAETDRRISINALTVLLREEGFARLPRRRDEERPIAIKAETAEVADVRRLDLSPRSVRTRGVECRCGDLCGQSSGKFGGRGGQGERDIGEWGRAEDVGGVGEGEQLIQLSDLDYLEK